MYCSNCGTQAVSDAEFCHKCGSQLSAESRASIAASSRRVFETCTVRAYRVEISYVPFKKATWRWFAEAMGPNGAYTVAASLPFKAIAGNENFGPMTASGQPPAESESARSQLLADLLKAGWEPIDAYGREYRRVLDHS